MKLSVEKHRAKFFYVLEAIESHPTAVLVFLLALVVAVRIAIGLVTFSALNPAESNWSIIANNLATGQGYSIDPDVPTAYRGPVPIFMLAGLFYLFEPTRWTVMIANWVFDVGTAYLIFRIALEIFPNRLYTAYAAVALWAVYLPAAYESRLAVAEPVFTFLVAWHMLTLIRLCKRPSVSLGAASGLLLGLAVLSRPVVLLWGPVVWVLVLVSAGFKKSVPQSEARRQILLALMAFTLVFCLTLLPWVVRNFLVFDAFIPGTLASGYVVHFENVFLGKSIVRTPRTDGEYAELTRRDFEAHGERYPEGPLSPEAQVEFDSKRMQFSIERILDHPLHFIKGCGYRFLRFWFNLGYGRPPSTTSYAIAAVQAIFLVLVAGAFVCCKGDWRKRSIPLLALIVYFTAMHMLLTAWFRYVYSIMPYVFILAAYTIIHLIGLEQTRQSASRPNGLDSS